MTAKILTDLYTAFPVEIELDGLRIAYAIAASGEDQDVEYLAKLHELGDDTISFLIEEGFIRSSKSPEGILHKVHHSCRLTLKGFSILGTVPKSVDGSDDKRSLGAQLGEAVEEGAKSAAGELVSKVLSGAIQLGAGAIGFLG